MQSLIGAKFDGYEGGLVSVENPALLEMLVETGLLSRRCVPEAADVGHVVVSLDSDDTAFIFCYESLAFEKFLRHAYLTTAGPQQLILADERSLHDLLSEMLPAVLDRVPALTLDRFLRRGFGHPLGYLRMPFSRTPMQEYERLSVAGHSAGCSAFVPVMDSLPATRPMHGSRIRFVCRWRSTTGARRCGSFLFASRAEDELTSA